AMLADDRVTDGETQTARGRFGREVGIENFSDQIRRHTRAVIGDGDLDVAPGREREAARRVDQNIFGADLDAAAVRHRFPRVEHEGVDYLLDLVGIDLRFSEMVFVFNS